LGGSISNRPLNLLNIACNNNEDTPPPLLKFCNFLYEVVGKVRTLAIGEGHALLGKAFEKHFETQVLRAVCAFRYVASQVLSLDGTWTF